MEQRVTEILRAAVLGASRGLGRALVDSLNASGSQVLAVARKVEALPPEIERFACDLTRPDSRLQLAETLKAFSPDTLIYCAGGGPYGPFGGKDWKDHRWAMELNFIAPAEICHAALSGLLPSIRRIVFIGSSVAESESDRGASSYSAAKHGLLGLHRNLVEEKPEIDIRLYSPGYMDTQMLPPGATVRQKPLWDPKEVASDLLTWMKTAERHSHRRLALYP